MIRIDTDVPRGLKRYTALHLVGSKGGSERAKNGMTGLVLSDELVCPHKAIDEVDAVRLKPQGTDHTVTIEPVAVPQSRPCESGRTIEVIRPPDEIRDLAGNGLDGVRLLTRVEHKGTLEQRRAILHATPPHPAAATLAAG